MACWTFFLASVIGVWVSHKTAISMCKQDPRDIVIDEYAGMWLTLLAVPHVWHAYLLAFIAFRAFDIYKPSIIGKADKQLKGGFGIMLDDWLAGAVSGLLVSLFYYLMFVFCQNCVQFSFPFFAFL